MKRVTEGGTRKILFGVEMPGSGAPAVVSLVRGDKNHIPYLWIGAPDNGPCLGTMDEKEMLKLAHAILEEVNP